MTLINLDEVQNILKQCAPFYYAKDAISFIENKINSLQTYDPEQVIKDLIEELDITKIKNDPTVRAIWEIKKEALKLTLACITNYNHQ